MPFPIRPATPADVPSLQVVRQQAIEAGFSAHYPRSAFADRVAAPDDRLPAWIESATATVLVAETDVTAVGFGAYDAECARVLALYSAPEYAGRGCASAILDRFERRARDDGRTRLRATVPKNALGFFERRGFERRRATERDGLAMAEMWKPVR